MQSLQDALLNALKSPSPLAYLLVFLRGIIVSLGSCTIIELPVLVGYIGGVGTSSKRRVFTLTFLFILGMLTTYLIIGVAIGLASISLGRMATGSTFLYIGVGGISLVLGMSMLGFLPVPTTGLERLAKLKRGKTDLLGAYLIGMAFIFFEAPTCPACAPALMLISGYMVTKGKVFVGGESFDDLCSGTEYSLDGGRRDDGMVERAISEVSSPGGVSSDRQRDFPSTGCPGSILAGLRRLKIWAPKVRQNVMNITNGFGMSPSWTGP